MRRTIEEYSKVVEITGYRCVSFELADAYLKANRKLTQNGVDVQFFDAQLVATAEHLYFATLNALQAFQTGTNISKSIAVETALYAAARRQIQKAISQIGVKPTSMAMAVVVVGASDSQVQAALDELSACFGAAPDDLVLELTPQKAQKIREAFQISDKEIETAKKTTLEAALVDLVVEHVALLATQL
jgi:tRNA threonylcarbamoyladenosine modification (KEOPS) complex Cgi121 subunit